MPMDFGRWFAGQAAAPVAEEPGLPDGVEDCGNGVYRARCRSCEQDYELCCDPMDFTEEMSYCMGSDRCLP